MRISKFNHEGYYDPTTYRAFKNIEKDEKRKARFRPLVYICSPYAGGNKEKNIANAQRYCRFAVDSGCLPLAPHLYFPQFMDDSDGHDHNTAMFMNMMICQIVSKKKNESSVLHPPSLRLHPAAPILHPNAPNAKRKGYCKTIAGNCISF